MGMGYQFVLISGVWSSNYVAYMKNRFMIFSVYNTVTLKQIIFKSIICL